MGRWLHLAVLGIAVVALLPGGFLSVLLIIGAVGSGIESGFAPTDFIAIALMLLALALIVYGGSLLFLLFRGYSRATRIRLGAFYTAVAIYCGIWLYSSSTRDGITAPMFGFEERTMGTLLLLLPLVLVCVIPTDPQIEAEDEREFAEPGGGPNRRATRVR